MKRTDALTKSLAWLGTLLVAIPVLAPFATARWGALGSPAFRLDWLMPGELGLLVVAGGAVLFFASLRADSRHALVRWGIIVALGAFVAVSVIATTTGLASGAIEPAGWPLWLVMTGFGIYVGAIIELVVAGTLLLVDLYRHHEARTPPRVPAM